MSSLCSVCNSYPCPGCTSRYIDDVVRLKAELAASTCECTELRKDVSALKRTYMADFLKVAVDALDDVEDAGSHPVGAPGSVKRRAQDIGKRLRAMAVWLDKITGAAFFGATAPDDSTMQFTITVTAAEWREMRALVGVDWKAHVLRR